MYSYPAICRRVIDADSIVAEIDLGFSIKFNQPLRLFGINAPELNTPEGKRAKEFLAFLLEGKPVVVETVKDKKEKFGRYLATVFLFGMQGIASINDKLVAEGYAVKKDY